MGTTRIDWCDETVNTVTGCRGGCAWCYARRMAHRLAHIEGTVYQRVGRATVGTVGRFVYPTGGDHFAPAVHLDVARRAEDRLHRSSKPHRVFVASMGDFCFEGQAVAWGADGQPIPAQGTDEVQAHVARFAERLEQHTVLLLTKRPDLLCYAQEWPRNVHLGVSVTANADAQARVRELLVLRTSFVPRPLLWASVEPLQDPAFDPAALEGLDWVVVGLETGPRARARMDECDGVVGLAGAVVPTTRRARLVAAAERIVAWCRERGVPCFCKDNLRIHAPSVVWPRELPRGDRP